MQLNELPFYPYPKDAPTRLGFIVGDLIALGVVLLIFGPVVNIFLR